MPFTRGLGGRQGARAVNVERADLGDLPSGLVRLVLGVALQAEGRGFESRQLHHQRLPAAPQFSAGGDACSQASTALHDLLTLAYRPGRAPRDAPPGQLPNARIGRSRWPNTPLVAFTRMVIT
jgi:hypothetical protein